MRTQCDLGRETAGFSGPYFPDQCESPAASPVYPPERGIPTGIAKSASANRRKLPPQRPKTPLKEHARTTSRAPGRKGLSLMGQFEESGRGLRPMNVKINRKSSVGAPALTPFHSNGLTRRLSEPCGRVTRESPPRSSTHIYRVRRPLSSTNPAEKPFGTGVRLPAMSFTRAQKRLHWWPRCGRPPQ